MEAAERQNIETQENAAWHSIIEFGIATRKWLEEWTEARNNLLTEWRACQREQQAAYRRCLTRLGHWLLEGPGPATGPPEAVALARCELQEWRSRRRRVEEAEALERKETLDHLAGDMAWARRAWRLLARLHGDEPPDVPLCRRLPGGVPAVVWQYLPREARGHLRLTATWAHHYWSPSSFAVDVSALIWQASRAPGPHREARQRLWGHVRQWVPADQVPSFVWVRGHPFSIYNGLYRFVDADTTGPVYALALAPPEEGGRRHGCPERRVLRRGPAPTGGAWYFCSDACRRNGVCHDDASYPYGIPPGCQWDTKIGPATLTITECAPETLLSSPAPNLL